jgi:integrase/recombinase XerD
MLASMLIHGFRQCEMRNATIGGLIEESGVHSLRVFGKTRHNRVFLHPGIVNIFRRWLDYRNATGEKLTNDSPLFPSSRGKDFSGGHRLSSTQIAHIANEALIRANLKYLPGRTITGHSYRHTAALNAYRASNYNLIAVQEMLGHRNINSTIKYLRLIQKAKENPTNCLPLIIDRQGCSEMPENEKPRRSIDECLDALVGLIEQADLEDLRLKYQHSRSQQDCSHNNQC